MKQFFILVAMALLATLSAQAQAPSPADAMALEQQGKLPEAVLAWKAVTARNPGDARALASLGVVLARQEDVYKRQT